MSYSVVRHDYLLQYHLDVHKKEPLFSIKPAAAHPSIYSHHGFTSSGVSPDMTNEQIKTAHAVMDLLVRAMDSFYPDLDHAMVWLLRFLQTDLSKMSPSEFDPLRYEIASFVWHGPPQLRRVSIVNAKGWQTPVLDRLSIPSLDEAVGLQAFLRGKLDKFMQEGRLSFEMPSMTKWITRRPRLMKIGTHTFLDQTLPHTWWEASSVRDAFIYYFDQLLDRFALNLHQCPSTYKHGNVCKKIFLSTRHDQKYCGTGCENRVNAREYRKRKKRESRKNETNRGVSKRKGGHNGTKRR